MRVEEEVGALLSSRGLTLATAESCTGGLLANCLTNVAGSSAYFLGGWVAYAYRAKEVLLDVQHETLLAYGAVSKETAQEMARGARERLGSDVALSITGIAGPGGGMPNKPVGLVYVALSTPEGEECRRYVFEGDRMANKQQSVDASLQMLRDHLLGLGGTVHRSGA
jgi:PncC family amidohydrolase